MSEAFDYQYVNDELPITKKQARRLARQERRDKEKEKRNARTNRRPNQPESKVDTKPVNITSFASSMHHLMPKTHNQQAFQKAFNQNIPLICQFGSPGVGKTHFAIYLALKAVLNGLVPQTKVIVYQSASPAIDQGFLPGTLEEKSGPYANPSREGVESLFPQHPTAYTRLVEYGILEFRTTGYERGRNVKDAIVIIDETQNMKYQVIETLITRICENSRLIICADERQTDIKLRESGLKKLVRVLDRLNTLKPDSATIITYTPDDCLRHSLIKNLLKAAQEIELNDMKNSSNC